MMCEIEKKIEEFIMMGTGIQNIPYDLRIFENAIVNSLFAIELMVFIEREFEIKIDVEDLDMENFQTINAIKNYIVGKMI